ncbi:MAG: hypothetical protein ABJO36_10625 [Litorimonas sp.]
MSLFFNQMAVHGRIQLSRHLRSPAIWWLALAAPIGARFMVPDETASYSVMAVNDARLTLDSGVIGLQLGVIMAIILTPLAYIFLRAGPTRKTPWQAENVTPARRSAIGLGHWIADTLALWILMLALAGAGVVLAFFRLPLSEVNPFQIVFALCLVAAPALAVIAAFRTIFSTRPMLRKAGGDVLFFFLWMFLITLSSIFFAGGGNGGSPLLDVFGFAAPLSGATDYPIETLYVGGAPAFEKMIEIDAMAGVTDSGFLMSRLFWICAAGLAVFLSGLVFKPTAIGWVKDRPQTNPGPAMFSGEAIAPLKVKTSAIFEQTKSEWMQVLRPIWFAGLLLAVAIAGAVLPFRGMVGPAIAILLIFPLTQHGARWRGLEMSRLTNLAPTSAIAQVSTRIGAFVLLGLALCLPSFGRMIVTGNLTQLGDIAAVGVGLPVLALALSHLTRGPVAGRLILLILWYGYLNIGPAPTI